jgi:hypothetical protein
LAEMTNLHDRPGLHKFGLNREIDKNSTPESIWDIGGLYNWPDEADTTTVVSSSSEDAPGGMGVYKVRVIGLGADGFELVQDVTLNGLNPVTVPFNLLRCYRVYTISGGSMAVNAGDITVQIGGLPVARILAGYGQTQMLIYTVPADYSYARMSWLQFYLTGKASGTAIVRVFFKAEDCTWRVLTQGAVSQHSSLRIDFNIGYQLPALTDIDVRVQEASDNGLSVGGIFELEFYGGNAG